MVTISGSRHRAGSKQLCTWMRVRARALVIACLCLYLVVQLLLVPLILPQNYSHVGHHIQPSKDPIDGYFNGAPVTLRSVNNPHSAAHCIGDNYQTDAWLGRSCQFSFLCFNTTSYSYVVFQSTAEAKLRQFLDTNPFMRVTSTLTDAKNEYPTVSLGGINIKWGKRGFQRLEWFPTVQRNVSHLTYYELPPSVVMVPFHSMNGANPGHLVWDDFMSIYNLLHMFDLLTTGHRAELLLMRYILPIQQGYNRGLWASCDMNDKKTHLCHKMIHKFIPLMVGHNPPYHWSTTHNFDFSVNNNQQPPQSDLVCSKRGVAGLGVLTDHGVHKTHGWVPEDYNFTHNYGRGGLFRDFRNFAIRNLGLSPAPISPQPPFHIVFSVNSSEIESRMEDFRPQIELVKQLVPSANVEAYQFKDLSLQEQMEIASRTAIFITVCGGGAVTGMFLPPGASVILYYHERGGVRTTPKYFETGTPAMLDWDLYNSLTHLRVHWLPKVKMNQMIDEMALVALIRHELSLIESRTFVDDK